MTREATRHNEKAAQTNPSKSGMKTGNPQLETHEGGSPTRPGQSRPRLPAQEERKPRQKADG